jgi:uncharacterized protein (TIGR03067 family)
MWVPSEGGGSIGLLAAPAEINVELFPGDSDNAPRETVKPAAWKAGGVPPVWGASVAGMQVGVRFKDGKNRFKLGETVTLEWYLRNLTDRQYTHKVFVPDRPNDFVLPSVVDLQGKRQQVHRNNVWTPGIEPGHFEEKTIPSGEAPSQGAGSFEIRTEVDAEAERLILVARPGKYKLTIPGYARWNTIPDFGIYLESGQLEFEIVDPKTSTDEKDREREARRKREQQDDEIRKNQEFSDALRNALERQLEELSRRNQAEKTVREKMKELERNWLVVSVEIGGKPTLPDRRPKTVEIKDDTLTLVFPRGPSPSAFTIDPTRSPHHIDLKKKSDDQTVIYAGIYKIENDQLFLCLPITSGQERPDSFETKNKEWSLLIAKKAK